MTIVAQARHTTKRQLRCPKRKKANHMVSMLLCFCRYEHRTTISGGPLLDGDSDPYVPPFVILVLQYSRGFGLPPIECDYRRS